MLGEFFLKTNEVSLERVGGQRTGWDESEDDDLIVTSDVLTNSDDSVMKEGGVLGFSDKNRGLIPIGFVKSKSIKLCFQFSTLLSFALVLIQRIKV